MKLIIHKGTKEIGGSCVEVRSDNSKILIDFGMPLTGDNGKEFDKKILEGKTVEQLVSEKLLPDIENLYTTGEGIAGILISHSHLDHYGYLQYASPSIPIYLSKGAKELIDISAIFIPSDGPKKIKDRDFKIVQKYRDFKLEEFNITPLLVDHSAFDALAFIIEAEGKRVFYSGDFRATGNKSILFDRMIENPPENIDVLLLEGTMMGRNNAEYPNEKSIRSELIKELKSSGNISFLMCSGQNIDRIVSTHIACNETGRIMVIDLYQAYILEMLRKIDPRLPDINKKNIRIKYWKYHADRLAEAGYEPILYTYNKRKIEFGEITKKKDKILMLCRDNSLFDITLRETKELNGANVIWSMWEGYLEEEFKEKIREKGISLKHIHTSGHATREDLQKFASALKPKRLIPIHTEEPETYKTVFDNVKIHADGEVINI